MSSVIRPAGPLPRRVYWVRRMLLLVITVVTVSLLWWMLGRVMDSADESATSVGSSGSGTVPDQPEGDNGVGPGPGGSGQHQSSDNVPRDKSHKPRHGHKAALAAPTGDCAPADVAMTVGVDDAKAGHSTPIDLKLTTVSSPGCTLAITPDALVLRITSGNDVVWSSDDCPDELLAQAVVVREHPATVYTFGWNGRRSTDLCNAPGNVAEPGGYWAEAALVGADAHRAYFDIR